jgi:hypothetical protein
MNKEQMRLLESERISLETLQTLANENLSEVDYLVIGGWCAAAYIGNVRFTADIDILCKPFTKKSVVKKFDAQAFSVREVFYGIQAKHRKTGIHIHINTDAYVHDRSTGTKVSVPSWIFAKPRRMSIGGIFCTKKVNIPVAPLEYLMVLKAIPDRDKDDFDFAMLLARTKFDVEKFAKLLQSCSSSPKPFTEKEKRLRFRNGFIKTVNKFVGALDAREYRCVLMKLEEIDKVIRKGLKHG